MVRSLNDVADFRQRLCETAAGPFVEQGLGACHMRELASRLGVNAMTPYRYFRDKNEIFPAVRARAFRRFVDQLEAATYGSQWDRSGANSRAYVRFALEEQTNYRPIFDLSQLESETITELEWEERRAATLMRTHVDMLVETGVLEGDADLIAKVLWAALHGVVVLHLGGKLTSMNFGQFLSETMRVIAYVYRPAKITVPSQIPAAHERPSVS